MVRDAENYMTNFFRKRRVGRDLRKLKRKTASKALETRTLPVKELVLKDNQTALTGTFNLDETDSKNLVSFEQVAKKLDSDEKISIVQLAKNLTAYLKFEDDKGNKLIIVYDKGLVHIKANDKKFSFFSSRSKIIYTLASYAKEPLKSIIQKHLADIIELWFIIFDYFIEREVHLFNDKYAESVDLSETVINRFLEKAFDLCKKVRDELTQSVDTSGFERVDIEPLVTFELEDHIALHRISNLQKLLLPIYYLISKTTACDITTELYKKCEPELYERIISYVNRRMKTLLSGAERVQFWSWLSQFVDPDSIAIELLHLIMYDFLVHAYNTRSYPAYIVSLSEKAINLYFLINIQDTIQYFENLGIISTLPKKKYNALLFDRDVITFVVPVLEEHWDKFSRIYDELLKNLNRMQHIGLLIAPYLYKLGYTYSQYTLSREKLPVALFLSLLLKHKGFNLLPLLLTSYRVSGVDPEKTKEARFLTGNDIKKIKDPVLATWIQTSIYTFKYLLLGEYYNPLVGKKFTVDGKLLASIGQELVSFLQILSTVRKLQFGTKVFSVQ